MNTSMISLLFRELLQVLTIFTAYAKLCIRI